MNCMELISNLCGIIDKQNEIIQAQAVELGQLNAIERAEEIDATRQKYADVMGAAPNNNEGVTAT